MPHVQRPAFEQFRRETISRGRPMLEKNVVPIQAKIVAALEALPSLLVEKTRRLPHDDGMIEVSAKWFGPGEDQSDVVRILKKTWPDEELGAQETKFTALPSDEAVLLMFAATYEDGRFLTGRVLITF